LAKVTIRIQCFAPTNIAGHDAVDRQGSLGKIPTVALAA